MKLNIFLMLGAIVCALPAGCGRANYPDMSSPKAVFETSRLALQKGDVRTYLNCLADISKLNYGISEKSQLKNIKEKLKNSDFKDDILNYDILESHEEAMVLTSGQLIDGYIVFEQKTFDGSAKLRVSLLKYKDGWKLLQTKDFILEAKRAK
ncbi:MAG: hypothetical protein PHO00_00300 [bacterium]|nr:hypothetical protein [bacterium]